MLRGAPLDYIDDISRAHMQLDDMLGVVAGILSSEGVPFFLAAGTALGAAREGGVIPWDFDGDLLVPVTAYRQAEEALARRLPPRYAVSTPRLNTEYEVLFARVHLREVHDKYLHLDLFPLVGTSGSPLVQHVHLRFCQGLRMAFKVSRRARRGAWRGGRPSRLFQVFGTVTQVVLPDRLLIATFWRLGTMFPFDRASTMTNLAAGYLTRECMPRSHFATPQYVMLSGRPFPAPNPVSSYLTRLYGDYMRKPSAERQARELQIFEQFYLPGLRDVVLDVSDGETESPIPKP